jgi:hypothetical protein
MKINCTNTGLAPSLKTSFIWHRLQGLGNVQDNFRIIFTDFRKATKKLFIGMNITTDNIKFYTLVRLNACAMEWCKYISMYNNTFHLALSFQEECRRTWGQLQPLHYAAWLSAKTFMKTLISEYQCTLRRCCSSGTGTYIIEEELTEVSWCYI